MSWQESTREVHNGMTYVTFRCGWCRRYAVATEPYKPSRCCCNPSAKGK